MSSGASRWRMEEPEGVRRWIQELGGGFRSKKFTSRSKYLINCKVPSITLPNPGNILKSYLKCQQILKIYLQRKRLGREELRTVDS